MLGGPELLFTSGWALILQALVTVALGVSHPMANEGILISDHLAFLPGFTEREFNSRFEVNHPRAPN